MYPQEAQSQRYKRHLPLKLLHGVVKGSIVHHSKYWAAVHLVTSLGFPILYIPTACM